MSILFAANECESFSVSGTFSARAECENGFTGATHGMGMTTGVATSPVFTGQTNIWVAVGYATSSIVTGTGNVVALKDSGAGRIQSQVDVDSYGWSLEYWDGAAYQEVSGPWPADTYCGEYTSLIRLTLNVKIHASTGYVKLWLDDCLLYQKLNFDTTQGSVTQIDQVILSDPHTGTAATCTELIVSDKPTWWKRLASLIPTGNSATNTAWTGDYTAIDDSVVINDGDSITDNNNSDVDTYTKANLATQPANMIPETVIIGMRAQNAAGGVQNIQGCIRQGGTNYFSASLSGLGTTLSPYQVQWTTDPAGGAWTVSGVNSAEIGVQAVT